MKRDRNNFISIILNKIALAKNFHQRVALSITSKRVLTHIKFKFYLRRRYKKLYLYIRVIDNFGNTQVRHQFIKDIVTLIPKLRIVSLKGHFTGWIIQITEENQESLILFLKLTSLLSTSKDFYAKKSKVYLSFYNYCDASSIPIHIKFTNKLIEAVRNVDLYNYLTKEIKEYDKARANNNSDNNSTTCDNK